MVVKIIIVLFLIIILYALGSGLYYLVREQNDDSDRVAKALTWRIVLSLILFVLLFVAFALGWITPHGV